MMRLRNRRPLLLIIAAACVAGPAWGEPAPFCPMLGEHVNPARNVDKDELAATMLDQAGVSRLLERRARPHLTRSDLTVSQTLIAMNIQICDTIACSDADKTALRNAATRFRETLDATDHYVVTAPDRDPRLFFTNPESSLRCKAEDAAPAPPVQVAEPNQAPPFSLANFRIRGSATGLTWGRDSREFSDADKAELSFSDDNEAGKRTTTLVAAIGYSYRLFSSGSSRGRPLSSGYVVPYFAINYDTARSDGQARTVSSDLFEFGSIFEFRRATSTYATYFSVIPRLLVNRDEHSSLAGLNLLFRPTFGFVNQLQRTNGSPVWWNVVLDARFNNGVFLRRGDRAPDDAHDFSRIGGSAGIVFTTLGGDVPVELTVADTYLVGLAGHPNHMNRFHSDFSMYFDPDKNFGVSFGYARGRIEDLDSREDKWTLGFAVRY